VVISCPIGKDHGRPSERSFVSRCRGPLKVDRLRLETLGQAPAASRPKYDPHSVRVGILHLGIGAFHRAHQAIYTDDAIALGDDTWGICGVTQRSAAARDTLAPQDYLYSVLERGPESDQLRVIASVRDVVSGPHEAERLTAAFANPLIKIVSLTVTEKGYHCDLNGALLADDDAIRHDLSGALPITVLGRLVNGLDARQRADSGPLAVMSCDNLPRNGRLLKGAVDQFVDRLRGSEAKRLAGWISDNVTFPSSVVDRIVPKTSEAEFALVEADLGLRDSGALVTEPYRQWVIEGGFPSGRPRWPGVIETSDIQPYENQKLRLLNATHSALAYLGALAGFTSIAETISRDEFRKFGARLMIEDAVPTLQPAEGIDLAIYSQNVLERFANPHLTHRCDQIATDGSQKLPIRLLPSAQSRLSAGGEPRWICLAIAAWMRFLGGIDDTGRPLRVEDKMASVLTRLATSTDKPAELVDGLLGVPEIFPTELRENDMFRSLIIMWLGRLADQGVEATLVEL